jgi:hypothetical protein
VREILKVFVHSPPPLEREGIFRTVGLRIPEVTLLSIQKGGCENYLYYSHISSMNLGSVVGRGSRGRIYASPTKDFACLSVAPPCGTEAGAFFSSLVLIWKAHGLPRCPITHRIGVHPLLMLLFSQYLCYRNQGTLILFPLWDQTAPPPQNWICTGDR